MVSGAILRCTGFIDSRLNPVHYFILDPANRTGPKVDLRWKVTLVDQVINSGPRQARPSHYFGKPADRPVTHK